MSYHVAHHSDPARSRAERLRKLASIRDILGRSRSPLECET